MLYIDNRACTVFLCLEQPGSNAGDVRRGQFSRLGNLHKYSCSKASTFGTLLSDFPSLESCRGAFPVADVLVKIKRSLNLDHEFSEMCVQGVQGVQG